MPPFAIVFISVYRGSGRRSSTLNTVETIPGRFSARLNTYEFISLNERLPTYPVRTMNRSSSRRSSVRLYWYEYEEVKSGERRVGETRPVFGSKFPRGLTRSGLYRSTL